MKFEKDEAINLIVELIRVGKINLPERLKYSASMPAPDYESLFTDRAQAQAKYLRSLLEELTKDDQKK